MEKIIFISLRCLSSSKQEEYYLLSCEVEIKIPGFFKRVLNTLQLETFFKIFPNNQSFSRMLEIKLKTRTIITKLSCVLGNPYYRFCSHQMFIVAFFCFDSCLKLVNLGMPYICFYHN